MTTISATPATLAAVLKAAQPGDTLALSPGSWGDGDIRNVAFAAPGVTLVSADPPHPAVFRSMMVMAASGLTFDGVNIAFTPDATTVSNTSFLQINSSHDIAWRHSKIVGGAAITGVPENATKAQQEADTTGNILGRPTGYAVRIVASQNVTLQGNDVSQADRLIILDTSSTVLLRGNYLHDRRRTAIAGSNVSDVTIDGNVIAASNPWRMGDPSVYGDHADMLAFWSAGGQTTPNARLTITGNIMAQLSGPPILGMWFAGSVAAPYTDFTVSGNLILAPNLQGIMLADVTTGTIRGNTLVQVPLPSMTADQLAKQFPTILLLATDPGMGPPSVAITNNAVGVEISDKSGGANLQSGTTITTPTKDGGVTEIRAWLLDHPGMAGLAAPLLPVPPVVDLRAVLVKVQSLAASGRKAKAKNGWFDQISAVVKAGLQ